jgi:thiol-disulfide isomerase/thioredoxin
MANQFTSAQSNGGVTTRAKVPNVFPWPLGNMIVPAKGCGLGDPTTANVRNQAMPWRDQVGYWIFRRDGATGALSMPAGTQVLYFASGDGEEPPGNESLTGWGQNISDTNLFAKGAPVTRDSLFACVAMGVTIGRPFSIPGSPGSYTSRDYPAWVDDGGYADRARELIAENVGLAVTYRDSACNFDLGAIANYVPAGGLTGGSVVRPNNGYGIMSMLPILRGPVYMGAVDEANQATFTASFSAAKNVTIASNPAAATVTDLAVPVRLTAYGDFGPWCGPCAPTEEELEQLVEAMVAKRLAGR